MGLKRWLWMLFFASAAAAQVHIVDFGIQEDSGIRRHGMLFQQGVPVSLSPDEVAHLAVMDERGQPVPAAIEIDGKDPAGKVRWLRVALRADLEPWETRRYQLVDGAGPAHIEPLRVVESPAITVTGPGYTAIFRNPADMEIREGDSVLFSGAVRCQIYPDARSIINAGGKTTVLSGFFPKGWRIEKPSPYRTVVTLTARYPKQASYSSGPGQVDPNYGYDVDVRFEFSALAPVIRFDWRLINRAGYKSWLERYALLLPLARPTAVEESDFRPQGTGGSWINLKTAAVSFGVSAPFARNLGAGTGVQVEPDGLAIGGIALPPDGSLAGATPEIHRLFHYGMSRTFGGVITMNADARAGFPLDFKLPAQYYSDLNVLPEEGDKVTPGEFAGAIERSARWLLATQWTGTLWAGEWWREWDVVRRQGTEETSNANQELAPLYHYFRTGDTRFLNSAALSAWYVYDIQHDKKQTGFGPMLHTRRHLLDELNWIHPRYQRASGAILASHVLLADRERNELIATVRHFSEQIQDPDGTPHDWDEGKQQRGRETGVDTTNFVAALISAWIETGDNFFLDRARGYTRWSLKKWRNRTDNSKWNWNLTRYIETGLLAICEAARQYPGSVPEEKDFLAGLIDMSRYTLGHPQSAFVPGTLGEGGLHYIFYHASLDARVSRLAHDPTMLQPLLKIVRSQVIRQDSSGAFPMDVGSLWSQYPTQIISSYDAESVAACFPVLAARLAATGQN